MKHITIKRMECLSAAVAALALAILSHLALNDVVLLLLIVAVLIVVIPCIYLDIQEGKRYPQWRNIWKLPKWAIAFLIVTLAVAVASVWIGNTAHVSWWIILIPGVRAFSEYLYSRKYDLDHLHSVEELLQAHPQARAHLRKGGEESA